MSRKPHNASSKQESATRPGLWLLRLCPERWDGPQRVRWAVPTTSLQVVVGTAHPTLSGQSRLALMAALVAALIIVQPLPAEESTSEPKQLPWLDSLARGYTQAQRHGRPIFVRAGTETCRFCRELDETIATPTVQQELQRWTLLEIDEIGRAHV